MTHSGLRAVAVSHLPSEVGHIVDVARPFTSEGTRQEDASGTQAISSAAQPMHWPVEDESIRTKTVGRAQFKHVGRETNAMIQAFRAIAMVNPSPTKKGRNKMWMRASQPVSIKSALASGQKPRVKQ